MEEDHDSHRKLPVFKKAMEIAKITKSLVDSFEEGKDRLETGPLMLSNAYTLGAKIAGAEGGDLYSIRIDNATLIKLAARDLMTQTSFCKSQELTDPRYLQLLRDELEEFRLLFLKWVASFDPDNDIKDEWSFL